MSFVWPARPADSHARAAVLVAMVLTAAIAAALSPSLARLYGPHGPGRITKAGELAEVTIYVASPASPHAKRRRPEARSHTGTLTGRRAGPASSMTDSGPPPYVAAAERTTARPLQPIGDAVMPASQPAVAAPAHAPLGPVAAPVAVTRSPASNEAYVPLRLRTKWKSFFDLVRETKPTPAERDSAYKTEERARVAARDDRRPMPIAFGHIRVPLFSRGPSHAQRLRDSIVNADYLRRLAILEARARAAQDSMRRVTRDAKIAQQP